MNRPVLICLSVVLFSLPALAQVRPPRGTRTPSVASAPGPDVHLRINSTPAGVLEAVDDATGTPLLLLLNPLGGKVGIGTAAPSSALDVNGIVRSASGFQFPDNTVQTTAATGGTVTSITAGSGLAGGTITTSGTIAVDSTVVRTSDPRLTDPRPPLAGSTFYIQNGSPGQTGSINVTGSITGSTFVGSGSSLTGLTQLLVAASDPLCNTSSSGAVYFNTSRKTMRYCDGSQFIDFAPQPYSTGAKYCSATSGSFNGQLSFNSSQGYRAGKQVCEQTCNSAEAHMCTGEELVRSSQLGLSLPSSRSWYSDGTTDCSGWTSSTGSAPSWQNNAPLGPTACSTQLPIACCF